MLPSVTERLCTYSDDDHNERGKPTPEYLELYRVWGEGEIGTIVLGNIPVDRTHLEGKGNAVIDKRNVIPTFTFLLPTSHRLTFCPSRFVVDVRRGTPSPPSSPSSAPPKPTDPSASVNSPTAGVRRTSRSTLSPVRRARSNARPWVEWISTSRGP